jgi:hypothetical protein
VAVFSKKRLTDVERQTWSAQLLEVREAELSEFGPEPVGGTWVSHDEWYYSQWITAVQEYGIALAGPQLAAQDVRPAGYRQFLEGEAMIVLADEMEDPPTEWEKGGVYWIVYSGQVDESGSQVWGWQQVASRWSEAKSYMMDRVKEFDLENHRKTLPYFADRWNFYFKIVATAIVAIVTVIVLLPIAIGAGIGIAVGAKVSLAGAASAGSAALQGSQALQNIAGTLGVFGGIFGGLVPEAGEQYQGIVEDFSNNNAEIVAEIDEANTAYFTANSLVITNGDAPTEGPQSSSGFPLILAAAGALVLL